MVNEGVSKPVVKDDLVQLIKAYVSNGLNVAFVALFRGHSVRYFGKSLQWFDIVWGKLQMEIPIVPNVGNFLTWVQTSFFSKQMEEVLKIYLLDIKRNDIFELSNS